MKKIDKHIIDLLHDNECVIVPKMGGFVISGNHEDIRSSQHPVSSLSKKIAFNDVLNFNDGLLANHIVQHEKLTYKEALHEIEEFVDQFHQMLASGKKFVIEEVGILNKDAKGNVQFEPLSNGNDLSDSPESSDTQYLAEPDVEIKQEEEKQPETPITLDLSEPQETISIIVETNKSNRVFTFLLWAGILWLCISVYIISPVKLNFAWLNSFFHSTTEQPVDNNESTLKSETSALPSAASSSPAEDANTKREDDARAALRESSAVPAAASAPSEDNFFIVAGSFKSVDNAKRKLDELKQQGYTHAQIINGSGGIQLVCYDGFKTHDEANEKMQSMKVQNEPAWIYSR